MQKLSNFKFNKIELNKIAFVIVFLLSCFTMNSNNLNGYLGSHSSVFAFAKVFIIAIAVAMVTYISRKDSKFTVNASIICCNIALVFLVVDNYTLKISGTVYLYRYWWLISIYTAMFAMVITVVILKSNKYNKFLNNFVLGLCPIYIYTFIICFLRDPSKYVRTINIVPFEGTFLMLKAFLNNPTGSFEAALLFFGNLLIFLPAAIIIKALLPKAKTSTIMLIGLLLPLFAEGYQYILACGDVDIDDAILNYIGYILGVFAYKIINKRLLPLR